MRIDTNTPQSFSSLNGAMKVTYTNNASQTENSKSINEPVKLNIGNNETIINARLNGYVNDEMAKRNKILEEHYTKMYQENIKFENPMAHISDKYYTENSPYYIKGLTQQERDIARSNEIRQIVLNKPIVDFFGYSDAVLKGKMTPVFDDIMRAEENAYNREAVNSQFQTLLNNHGVTIPKDEKLTFTIEPNYYTLKVNGAKDENLASAIEEILNKNSENVRQLFLHIMGSKFEENSQFTKEKQDKLTIVNSVKEVTGYNLADLEVRGDKFITPNGVDVFEIYKENFGHRKSLTEEQRNYVLIEQQNQLTELARKGFENVPDLILSIEYENESFYDIGQKENFGTGKNSWATDWINDTTNSILSGNDAIKINPYTQSINKYDLIKEIEDITGFN
ncbi:MAG TPA: DUF4885 family protein, partial [Aliarcobacter sp.]|nr:DUF4885 family protein [Aliarcobacter sp.]